MENWKVKREGCLSFPGIRTNVKRAELIRVSYLDENGYDIIRESDGLEAHCIQHEMDHLNGKTMLDRVGMLEKLRILWRIRQLKKAGKWK